MSGEPKRYSPEFKEQAAKKVIDNSLPIAQVARELGVNDTTLGFWVKARAADKVISAGQGAFPGRRRPAPGGTF